MKDLFDEIEEQKKELPKLKKISSEVTKRHTYNFYQSLAFWLFAFLFITGIILGNVFPACSEVSQVLSTCTRTEYNLSLTLLFWLGSFVFCSFIYAIGEIVRLLNSINDKLSNNIKGGKK